MMEQDLSSLGVFMDVWAYRSFRRAADARGVSPSSLSHAMRVLETQLGVRLLHRTTRSVALTEAGEAFLGRVAPALQEIRRLRAVERCRVCCRSDRLSHC